MGIQSRDPATGEVLESFPITSEREVDLAVRAAARAQRAWARASFEERARPLRKAAELLRRDQESIARLMAREMGKPLAQGRAEAEKCASVCEYYAEHAEEQLASSPIESDASRSYVCYRPLGVVLAIMPWNFPFWQVFRFAAPSLMAGNAALLKHAPNVFGCARKIAELLGEAGLPPDVFRVLYVDAEQVHRVLALPEVAAVTLTGSTRAGSAVAARAGELLKKSVLELGGSDPFVVLADADLEAAISCAVTSRCLNSGQSCIAAKRFIFLESVRAEAERLFVAAMAARRVGNPLDEGTDIGPLARPDLRDQLHAQVRASIDKGARCLLGGELVPGPGAFYPPTVLSGVAPGMPAYHEELFGPVASLIFVPDEREALRVANDTAYGLGAAVFTADAARGELIAANELEAGACFVNAFVRSDPRLPFGGIKQSGYGRELGIQGIHEFVNVKTVYVA